MYFESFRTGIVTLSVSQAKKIPNKQQQPLVCKHDRKKKKKRFVSASALVQCLDDNKVRSLYQKLDSDFRQKAKGDKSLRSNLANIYQLVWIVFFLVQRTMNFLFYTVCFNSFT